MTEHFEPVLPLVCTAPIEPAACQRVALALAEAQDNSIEGKFAAPMVCIAAWTGLSKGQARKHVHALLKLGVLNVLANANGGDRLAWPVYQFNLPRLRALNHVPGATPDLFCIASVPRCSFIAFTDAENPVSMAVEVIGRPGQRFARFVRETQQGDIPYGMGPLSVLLLPRVVKGAWTGWLDPQAGPPEVANRVFTPPATVERLQQWAQDAALGRSEGTAPSEPLRPLTHEGNQDGH